MGYHAERIASHLRCPSAALYHLFLLSPITFSAHRVEARPISHDSGTDPPAISLCGRGIRGHAKHIHLLITEPEIGSPSTVMQVLKQRTARALLPKRKRADPRQKPLFGDAVARSPFWQARFYDFNVWTTKKRVEKLRYMHRNPVKRGLVSSPEEWRWSSYRFYFLDEAGPVRVNEGWSKISFQSPAA
jgi:REP element-mobilizing transposase RayT